jgi:hypothetical protein
MKKTLLISLVIAASAIIHPANADYNISYDIGANTISADESEIYTENDIYFGGVYLNAAMTTVEIGNRIEIVLLAFNPAYSYEAGETYQIVNNENQLDAAIVYGQVAKAKLITRDRATVVASRPEKNAIGSLTIDEITDDYISGTFSFQTRGKAFSVTSSGQEFIGNTQMKVLNGSFNLPKTIIE